MEVDKVSLADEEQNLIQPNKKRKLFSSKDFRKIILTSERLPALREFLELCENHPDQLFEYFENGGNCLELFKILEKDPNVSSIILEIIHLLLLQIVARYPDLQVAAIESCRYFLNTHLTLINKLLGINSSMRDRKIILKLLTSIVTLSASLTKDILLHINFNEITLEVLAKPRRDSSRNAFIQFVVALIIEGDPTILLVLNDKKLLTSAIRNSQFDAVDIVCMVMLALKTHVLENTKMSKSNKMRIFSTQIIKEIINLYNWKGPGALLAKNKLQTIMPNEVNKSRVNKTVHELLLVLCTSHNLGIIFRDPSVGLSSKAYNNLMCTVLDSLEEPWNHSYAGELVQKICKACPDLVKTMWNLLKPFLAPRATSTWFKAIEFASKLVEELQPNCIEYCSKELSVLKLFQVIQSLIAPSSILQKIVLENFEYEYPSTNHFVLTLLVKMLKTIQGHLLKAREWLNHEDFASLQNLIQNYIGQTFPNAHDVFNNWSKQDDQNTYTIIDHIELILSQFYLYQSLCPALLDSLRNFNVENFMDEIGRTGDDPKVSLIQIRAVNLFIKFEPSVFAPETNLFTVASNLAYGHYSKTKDAEAKIALDALLKNTGIFDYWSQEMNIWINCLKDVREISYLIAILKNTSQNMVRYLDIMSQYKILEADEPEFHQDVIANLANGLYEIGVCVNHQKLSPLLLGSLEYSVSLEKEKVLQNYLNEVVINLFHSQTNLTSITDIVLNEKYSGILSKSVTKYVKAWGRKQNPVVLCKTDFELPEKFSSSFLEADVNELLGTPDECLNQALFYFTNINSDHLSQKHLENCQKVVEMVLQTDFNKVTVFEKVLLNSKLSRKFLGNEIIPNSFLIKVVEQFYLLEYVEALENCLQPYRKKLVERLINNLKNTKERNNLKNTLKILEVFKLNLDQCRTLLNCCLEVEVDLSDTEYLQFYYRLLTTILKLFECANNLEPLQRGAVGYFARFMTTLNRQTSYDTSACAALMKSYFEKFPHSLDEINEDLFKSIIFKEDFCKDNALLANFLLKKQEHFLSLFTENIETVVKSKGLLLSLLEASISIGVSDDILQTIYNHFEFAILKSLQKPQKAGRYFAIYSQTTANLITKCMPNTIYLPFVKKVHKFDTNELFHLEMLVAIYSKFIAENENASEYLSNVILTLVNFINPVFKKKLKSDEEATKLNEMSQPLNKLFDEIIKQKLQTSRIVCEKEPIRLFCKFCLKFGVSGSINLIRSLMLLVELVDFNQEDGQLFLDMLLSHSEFLEVLLHENKGNKLELLRFLLVLFKRWPSLKQRNHIPILLGAYGASIDPTDRIILTLLQMYEKDADQTNFYDFKPFLWGASAVTHYSVRRDIQKALFRQPKMNEVLGNIQQDILQNTIISYSLDSPLVSKSGTFEMDSKREVYDMAFLLPLFNHLLAPENESSPVRFIESGSLSMTIVALSSDDRDVRLAACHILLRLHHQIEAKGTNKSKVLWIRFIEALCGGTALVKDYKLNNFVAIFWAKMALILYHPLHTLYVPLSYYLGIKETPILNSIPELYTFLHSSSVNSADMQNFILEILRDGLRTDEDFSVALHAMAFKLIMELFSSCLANMEAKTLILYIIGKACSLNTGKNLLCERHGLLSWLHNIVKELTPSYEAFLEPLADILLTFTNGYKNDQICLIIRSIIENGCISWLNETTMVKFLRIVINCLEINGTFLSENCLNLIINVNRSEKGKYLLKYGSKFYACEKESLIVDHLVQRIIIKWINNK